MKKKNDTILSSDSAITRMTMEVTKQLEAIQSPIFRAQGAVTRFNDPLAEYRKGIFGLAGLPESLTGTPNFPAATFGLTKLAGVTGFPTAKFGLPKSPVETIGFPTVITGLTKPLAGFNAFSSPTADMAKRWAGIHNFSSPTADMAKRWAGIHNFSSPTADMAKRWAGIYNFSSPTAELAKQLARIHNFSSPTAELAQRLARIHNFSSPTADMAKRLAGTPPLIFGNIWQEPDEFHEASADDEHGNAQNNMDSHADIIASTSQSPTQSTGAPLVAINELNINIDGRRCIAAFIFFLLLSSYWENPDAFIALLKDPEILTALQTYTDFLGEVNDLLPW